MASQLRFCMLMLPLLTMMVAPTLQSQLKILDTPSGSAGPASCALTCSGIGRWYETGNFNSLWTDSSDYPGKAYKKVAISGCNFRSYPVVTTTTRSFLRGDCPSVTVKMISRDNFMVYTVEDSTVAEMKSKQCDIHWSAFGYNC